MAKFTVTTNSNQTSQETFSRIKSFLNSEDELKKIDAKIVCTFDDKSLIANANGSQFKAQMQVKPQGETAQVEVTVDLPFLLMPFKGKIQEMLQKKLGKVLA